MALLDDVFKKKKKKEENNKKVNTSETSSPSIQNTNSKPKKTVDSLPIGVQGSNFLTNTQKSSSSNINTIPQTKNQNTWDNVASFLKNVGRGTINSFGSAHKYAENITEIGNSNYKDSRERQFYTSPYVSMADKIRLRSAQNQYNSNIMSALQKNDGRTVEEKIKGAINKTKEENKDRVFDVPETNLTKKVASDIMEKQQNQMALETEKATGNISRFLIGDVAPSMGQNLTQSALSLINPALGIGFTTMSAGGSYFDEAKQRGMSDKKALLYSAIGAGVEGATEGISFENVSKAGKGIGNLIKTGSFKTLEDGGEAVVKNTLREALKNYGISVAEEGVQEFLTDPIMEAAADAIDGKGDWDNIWQRAFKSGLAGMISSAISGGATIGVQSCEAVVDKVATGQNVTQEELVKANNDAIKNGVQVGNTNVEQSNNLKTNLQSMINNLNISEESKQEIQSRISSDININDFEYKTITDSIKNEVRANAEQQATDLINNTAQQYDQLEQAKQDLDNIKPEDFKNKDYRKLYAQLQNETELEDPTYDKILTLYPTNKNGNRPLSDWQNIARDYGKAMAEEGRSFDEVRHNVVKIWQDESPYSRQQTSKNGQKVPTQHWYPVSQFTKAAYDSYRDTMKTQIAEQQKNLQANMESQVQAFKDEYDTIIDTIDNLGTQETQATITDEDNLITSAEKYGYNSKDISIENLQKLLDRRNIKGRFDASRFTNDKVGAFYNYYQNEDGSYTREVVINPNASEKAIIQELAMHELTHDIIASNTVTSKELYKDLVDHIKNFNQEEYNKAREDLDKAYREVNQDKSDDYFNSKEYQDMLDEESVTKVMELMTGTQERINRLVNDNRNFAQKIYDFIKDKIDTFKHRNDAEYLFWKDIQKRFDKAFAETEFNPIEESGSKSSIDSIDDRRLFVRNSNDRQVDVSNLQTAGNNVARYINNNIRNNNDLTIKAIDGDDLTITKDTAYKIASRDNVKQDGKYIPMSDEMYRVKLKIGTYIDEIAKTSRAMKGISPDTKNHKFAKDGFSYRKAYFLDNDGTYYSMNMSVGKNGEINTIYNLGKIKEAEFPQVAKMPSSKTAMEAQASNNSILPNNNKNVKYSIATDGSMLDNKGNKVTLDAETGSTDKTLLAIHNLNEDKLRGVLELGGFPVPSIAISNPNTVPHSEFGDISIVFDKETINPANRKNEVYDRDVWSPTFPSVNYDINNADIKKYVSNNLELNGSDPIINDAILDYFYQENLGSKVERYGLDKTLEIIKESKPMKYLYLTEVEKNGFKPVMKQANFSNSNDYTNQELQKFINEYKGTKPLNELSHEEVLGLEKQITKIIENHLTEEANKLPLEFRKKLKEVTKETISKYKDNYNLLNNFIYSANSMQTNGADSQVIDETKTLSYVDDAINQEEFEKWVDNTFGEMFKNAKKGIRNDKELFTPSGNRRSFNQLYDEYNLSNIVKALTKGSTKGGQENSIFGVGFGRISAQTANKFKSIEDIKSNENRLMTRQQAEEIIRPISEDLFTKIDEVADYYTVKYYDSDMVNKMQGVDLTSEIVEEFAGGSLTEDRLRKLLSEYNSYNIDKIPSSLLNGIIDDLKQIKNLPTDYFEAKPQRAVGFDEIDTVVLPSNTSEDIKQALTDRGIKYTEYDSNNENARSDILKALDEYKFSKETTNFDDFLRKTYGKYAEQGTKTTLGELRKKLPTKQKATQPILPTTKKTQTISSTIEEPTLKVPVPKGNTGTEQKVAKVLSEPITKVKPEQRAWALFKANILDKGAVFEDLSFKAKNRELQAKWDSTLLAEAKGQNAIGQARYEFENGEEKQVSKALTDIIDEVGENSEDFNNYMYHQLNIDRMTLEDRFDMANKPVFGDGIDANYSRQKVAELEKAHPEFKEYAQDVYDYLDTNKKELVDNGVISQETSDRFKELYPHYVPIARIDSKGSAINVPLDTNRTGVNSPIKRAKGGSQDIQPLFQTMADRTMQTYKASTRNNFGVELKNTLDKLGMFNQLETTTENADNENLFEYDGEKGNLTEGTKYQNPTFTVFENGEKVTYEINQDMYDALRPKNEVLSKWDNTKMMKTLRKVNDFRRGILTEYNPVFSITNAIKDSQDVLYNSQHATKTYAKYGEAYSQILKKGYWYKEYVQNGGSQNSYFTDGDFVKQDSKAKSIIKMPLEAISNVNNVIEMAPRLAEYIASREEGKSVQSAMLDASRVTTNFKAGGDITKFANRNGATFLNASVQGLQQNIRNIREANAKGLKGYGILMGKTIIASLPALILNNLVWKDDDDYEDLQDYVKDNYYIIAKIGDHKFLRIPKGRTVAVIQKAVTNISDFLTNKDEIDPDKYSEVIWGDLKDTFELASSNLAPNNPIENNIVSPIIQAATNKTWYGEDLVPTRLQEKPNEEKYDESTAEISKQISGILNKIGLDTNPMQINYLLDQYGGGVSDILLPLGTPQAENNVIEDKFTTDSVMKSRYPGEFFELKDKLAVNRNSSKATDKDELLYKYANSVSGELSDLYKQKREIQNSSSTDKEKKQQISEVQKQINSKTQQALKDIKTPSIDGDTATIGDSEFIRTLDANSGEYEWKKLTDKTKIQGVSLKTQADYENKVAKQKQKTDDPQLSDKELSQILLDSNYNSLEKRNIYTQKIGTTDKLFEYNPEFNIDEYLRFKATDIQGVKDSKGDTISGSKKQAFLDYVNNNISGYENRLWIMGKYYKLSRAQQKDLASTINRANEDEQLDIYKIFSLNFKVSDDGTVYYK